MTYHDTTPICLIKAYGLYFSWGKFLQYIDILNFALCCAESFRPLVHGRHDVLIVRVVLVSLDKLLLVPGLGVQMCQLVSVGKVYQPLRQVGGYVADLGQRRVNQTFVEARLVHHAC